MLSTTRSNHCYTVAQIHSWRDGSEVLTEYKWTFISQRIIHGRQPALDGGNLALIVLYQAINKVHWHINHIIEVIEHDRLELVQLQQQTRNSALVFTEAGIARIFNVISFANCVSRRKHEHGGEIKHDTASNATRRVSGLSKVVQEQLIRSYLSEVAASLPRGSTFRTS